MSTSQTGTTPYPGHARPPQAVSATVPSAPVAAEVGGWGRLRRWEVLARTAGAGAVRRGPVVEIRYREGPGVIAELGALLVAERRACPFLSWTLHRDRGHAVVRIVADPGRADDLTAIALLTGAHPP